MIEKGTTVSVIFEKMNDEYDVEKSRLKKDIENLIKKFNKEAVITIS